MRHAFTLVEMLVVIAVIAVLSIVVILILNPAETLKQSRDSNRVSDLSTLKTALAFYETQGGSSLGSASTSYVSIFDPTATSSAGDQCQGLSLPSLPANWTYHCAASSTYKNIDGTGWVPVNFSASQLKPPIAQLPVDPVNTASTGYYFTYTTNGTNYEMTASLESQKFASTTAVDGGQYSDLYETGSNLALAPIDYAGGSGGGGGGHNGYAYARTITMSNSNVSGTLSNFPMLFSGTYSYLAASSSAGNVQNGNGYDIIFASDSGCSSKLNFEQESYTSSTGNIVDSVKVPSITGGTVIYLCYGNANATSSQQNVAGTWDSNYKGVWHFPNGTALTATDSTSNGNNLTAGSAVTATAGEIDGGASFSNSTNSWLQKTSPTGVPNTFPITLEAWASWATPSPTLYQYIVQATVYSGAADIVSIAVEGTGSGHGGVLYYIQNNSARETASAPSANTLHHVVGVFTSSSAVTFYVDGVNASVDQPSGAFSPGAAVVDIGNLDGSTASSPFVGTIDEVRISNMARSSQWILTEYNNQSSPSTFYTVGSAM